MKKTLFIIVVLAMSSSYSNAQNTIARYGTTNNQIPSNIQRYGIDYELVDQSLLGQDSLILNDLNLLTIDAYREEANDVIFVYKGLDISIKVYSRMRASENKAYFTEPLNKNH